MIGFNANAPVELEKRGVAPSYVKLSVKATLKGGKLSLLDRALRPVADMAFSTFNVRMSLRAGGSLSLNFLLESFRVGDHVSIPGQRLDLVAPDIGKMASLAGVPPALLIVAVDLKPLDSPEQADVRVRVDTQPVLVHFSRAAVDKIIEFFTVEDSVSAEQLKANTSFGLEMMRERAAVNMKYALDVRTKLLIKLNMNAVTVVVPRNFTDGHCPALVVDLGRFTMSSELAKPGEVAASEDDEAAFYDSYSLTVSDINAFVTHNRQDWRSSVPPPPALSCRVTVLSLPCCARARRRCGS